VAKRGPDDKTAARVGKSSSSSGYVVFVSHSSFDQWVAKMIGEKVGTVGARPWLHEKDLAGGGIIVDEIMRGITACREAIVIVSEKSIASLWVPFEIGAVRIQGKRVTPILNNVAPDALAPLVDVKAIDLNNFGQFLAQLRERVGRR